MKFVLGITTFKRPEYLKQLISTWEKTKSNNEWKLIVADDGSGSKVFDYLKELSSKKRDYDLTIIECKDVGVHNLTNAIFKEIDGTGFDMCFKVDNDIYFKKTGWDLKYYEAAKETGFSHLVYNRNPHQNKMVYDKEKNRPMKGKGIPVAFGCFYTVTQEILDKVGYFDIKNFDRALFGHRDYSVRCWFSGFTGFQMWDIGGSQHYIEMQGKDGKNYIATHKDKKKKYGLSNLKRTKKIKVIQSRIRKKKPVYIPYNGFVYKSEDI